MVSSILDKMSASLTTKDLLFCFRSRAINFTQDMVVWYQTNILERRSHKTNDGFGPSGCMNLIC